MKIRDISIIKAIRSVVSLKSCKNTKLRGATQIKLIIFGFIFSNSVFALALGDTVNTSSLKAETNSTQIMKLAVTDAKHSQYMIKSTNGTLNILANNKNQVYGFNWSLKSPDLDAMIGNKYLSSYKKAYENRSNKYNHRVLYIETPNLLVRQFGLPGGNKEGEIIAKDLAPKD